MLTEIFILGFTDTQNVCEKLFGEYIELIKTYETRKKDYSAYALLTLSMTFGYVRFHFLRITCITVLSKD